MGVEGAASPLNDPGLVLLGAIIARRALLNAPGPVLLGAIISEKKIVKKNVFFLCSLYTVLTRLLLVRSVRKKYGRRGCDGPFPLTLFPLNSYNSAPIGPICTQKIWA
ncbi:hypothetical protein V1477_006374 [Vespula maculifrons]|uniref:Uncharacterized protein n=1 Tax=Vespula maculifrons TaxID=7453 RepID=A0ABD2CL32_VESMC